MWVLLQFISGSIQKNALADFLPVMKLFDLLYPEKEVSLFSDLESFIFNSTCDLLIHYCSHSQVTVTAVCCLAVGTFNYFTIQWKFSGSLSCVLPVTKIVQCF